MILVKGVPRHVQEHAVLPASRPVQATVPAPHIPRVRSCPKEVVTVRNRHSQLVWLRQKSTNDAHPDGIEFDSGNAIPLKRVPNESSTRRVRPGCEGIVN